MAITYLSNMSIDGTLTLTVNADADSTYTGIVVVESGLLKYRTKAQIKSDIGAGSGDGTITGSGTSGRLAKFNGSTSLTNSRIFESVAMTVLYDTASYPFNIQNDGGINIFKFEGQAVSNSSNFQITPGTETKPGLNFGKRSGTGATDTNTGIYSSATDHLEISTGGSKALGFDSSQDATFTADVSLTGGSLSISGDGSNAATLTESSAGILTIATVDDFKVDCAGDITLDTAGNDIRFKKSGTEYGKFKNDSGNFSIYSSIENEDILFKGNDAGTTITALTLDMSNAGSATFNDDIDLGGSINMTGSSKVIRLNSGGYIDFDGTNLQFNTQRNPNTGTFNDTDKSHAHIGLQGADGGSQIVFGTAAANNTTATTRMTINKAGLVGIGITPVEVLDLQTSSGDCRIRLDAPAASDTEIKFFNDGVAQYTIGHDDATDNFVIGGANVDAALVTVDKSGNLAIPQTEKIRFDGASGHTYMSETSDSNLKLFVAATEVVNFTNDFVDFQKYIDIPNLKINSSQGTSGQVLQSTGSGIQWATLSSGVTGSGTVNTIPLWASSTQLTDSPLTYDGSDQIKLSAGTPEFRLYDTSSAGSLDLSLNGVNANLQNNSNGGNIEITTQTGGGVGINTSGTVGSALDVNGTVRVRNQLNVGETTEQNLFVAGGSLTDGGERYAKFGFYGEAELLTPGGTASSQLADTKRTTAAFGTNGKLLEDLQYVVIKVEPGGFVNRGGWATSNQYAMLAVESYGLNTIIVLDHVTVWKTAEGGGSGSSWTQGDYGGVPAYQIVQYEAETTQRETGLVSVAWTYPAALANYTGQFAYTRPAYVGQGTERPAGQPYAIINNKRALQNRGLYIQTYENYTSVRRDSIHYIRLAYRVFRRGVDFVDATALTITGSGANGPGPGSTLTSFTRTTSTAVFNDVCSATGSATAYHNGSGTYPVGGDNVYTASNGSSFLAGGYYKIAANNTWFRITGGSGEVSATGSC